MKEEKTAGTLAGTLAGALEENWVGLTAEKLADQWEFLTVLQWVEQMADT